MIKSPPEALEDVSGGCLDEAVSRDPEVYRKVREEVFGSDHKDGMGLGVDIPAALKKITGQTVTKIAGDLLDKN